jgi:hypothetical protein
MELDVLIFDIKLKMHTILRIEKETKKLYIFEKKRKKKEKSSII